MPASGDPSSSNETHINKKYHDERDEKTQCSIFDKYLDGLDSNGFVADIVPASTPEVVPVTSGDKSDSPMEYNDAYLEAEFKKMAEQINDINSLFEYDYGQPVENSSLSGVGGGSGPSVNTDDIEMDATYFKENLLAAAKNVQKSKSALSKDTMKANNSPNPEIAGGAVPKVNVSEDIECIVESCSILKRSNCSSETEEELVEIAEIVPTNSNCNQLLVKLVKTKLPSSSQRMIITEVGINADSGNECDDDYTMNEESEICNKSIGGKLMLFDCVNGVIPNEHKMAMTFNRDKYPKQICMLPNFNSISSVETNLSNAGASTNAGAFCVVCADGSIELFSLADFQRISTIKEDEHQFISVAYCRSLERLCCCTRKGSLIFYSLSDADNESGDEMIDMEEETCPPTLASTSNNDNTTVECCVTDGITPLKQNELQDVNFATTTDAADIQKCTTTPTASSIRVDCGSGIMPNSSGVISQSSPSPSSTSINVTSSNLLAYRSGDMTLEDLRTLYSLTQFEDKVIPYTAEVPSCWNDLVQAQKQRKQSQHTWRLHNDA